MRSLACTLCGAALLACPGDTDGRAERSDAPPRAPIVHLTGAGATFPYPVYARWFSRYAERTGVNINYQSVGSGMGVRLLSEGRVDFGATDSPAIVTSRGETDEILHLPTVIGAVAITYNLPELTAPLRLSGPVLADIFLGRIVTWNDRRITRLNPRFTLPPRDIVVVHRVDASGTTYAFTEFLAQHSAIWRRGPGVGESVRWPRGMPGRGNEGVAGSVKQTAGSIGFVELTYAMQNRLAVAPVLNSAGEFVVPSVLSVAAAAAGGVRQHPMADDLRGSIVNAPGAAAYPISSFTYLLVPTRGRDPAKTELLVEFIRWALRDGSSDAVTLGYSPLPDAALSRVEALLESLLVAARARSRPESMGQSVRESR